MNIVKRLNEEINKDMIDKIFDFISSLDPDKITEEQADDIVNILDMIDPPINEGFYKKRVRRDLQAARKRRREHRRHRATKRLKVRRFRRSARGKRLLRKTKRMAKRGRTSTGKRRRIFIGPKLTPKTQRLKPMRKY